MVAVQFAQTEAPEPPHYERHDFNRELVRRGSLSIWFDPETQWLAAPTGKRGHADRQSRRPARGCRAGDRHRFRLQPEERSHQEVRLGSDQRLCRHRPRHASMSVPAEGQYDLPVASSGNQRHRQIIPVGTQSPCRPDRSPDRVNPMPAVGLPQAAGQRTVAKPSPPRRGTCPAR